MIPLITLKKFSPPISGSSMYPSVIVDIMPKRSLEALEEPHNLDESSANDASPSTKPVNQVEDEANPASLPSKSVKKKRKQAVTAGIVYISRLPPGMTPQKVRHLMAKWGDVGKVYAQRKGGKCHHRLALEHGLGL